MAEQYLFPFIVLTLLAVIIIQAVERYFFAHQTQESQSKLLAAVMSKNIGEYNAAIRTEKEVKTPDEINSDEVPLDDASDEEFSKFIKAQVK